MELFNKREDVIDLELTPYGELLLLEGVFKPTYYAFFDDEVLYDSRYAGIEVEAQNKIKDRIKEKHGRVPDSDNKLIDMLIEYKDKEIII